MENQNTQATMQRRQTHNGAAKAEAPKDLVESIISRVGEMEQAGEISFPPRYNPGNALRSAWLQIQETKSMDNRPAMEVCSKESIANALLNTVIQGLSPAKKQVYYIVYGNQLQAQRSYFGTMAAAKRIPGVKDVWADVVYEGDEFQAHKRHGGWEILQHESAPENIDPAKIRYAYAVIERCDDEPFVEIMTWAQIQQSWAKSKNTKQTVHKEFPDQMAKRTVINRACKMFFNTSDDSDQLIDAFNATGDRIEVDAVEAEPKEKAKLDALNAELSEGGSSDA